MADIVNDFDFPGRNIKWGQEGAGVNSIVLLARTYATLPATPTLYMETIVKDSTTNLLGATIAGGGTNIVKAMYNGSHWIVTCGISTVTVPFG